MSILHRNAVFQYNLSTMATFHTCACQRLFHSHPSPTSCLTQKCVICGVHFQLQNSGITSIHLACAGSSLETGSMSRHLAEQVFSSLSYIMIDELLHDIIRVGTARILQTCIDSFNGSQTWRRVLLWMVSLRLLCNRVGRYELTRVPVRLPLGQHTRCRHTLVTCN